MPTLFGTRYVGIKIIGQGETKWGEAPQHRDQGTTPTVGGDPRRKVGTIRKDPRTCENPRQRRQGGYPIRGGKSPSRGT